MKIYYRISDKSYPKIKLIGSSKEVCLVNFCNAFAEVIFGGNGPPEEGFVPPITFICDNCERKTVKMVTETGLPHTLTERGNAGSLHLALKLAIEECPDDELVYFCEDDYLHLSSAPRLLQEGIKRADYVTLYDHPDKYSRLYGGGEHSKVIRTASSHWRYTASTCMTFATKVKTIKEDLEIWEKHISGVHPHDHLIFTELGKEKQRRLAVCIPGVACHTDLAFSNLMHTMLIDAWAIDLMIMELERQLSDMKLDGNEEYHLARKSLDARQGKEKLMALDALRLYFSNKKSDPN